MTHLYSPLLLRSCYCRSYWISVFLGEDVKVICKQ